MQDQIIQGDWIPGTANQWLRVVLHDDRVGRVVVGLGRFNDPNVSAEQFIARSLNERADRFGLDQVIEELLAPGGLELDQPRRQ